MATPEGRNALVIWGWLRLGSKGAGRPSLLPRYAHLYGFITGLLVPALILISRDPRPSIASPHTNLPPARHRAHLPPKGTPSG